MELFYLANVVYTDNFGFHDHEKKLPVDSKTMFPICSMTKGSGDVPTGTSSAKGKFYWDIPLSQILPEFVPCSVQLKEKATLSDVLTMRSRMDVITSRLKVTTASLFSKPRAWMSSIAFTHPLTCDPNLPAIIGAMR